jgi:Protein of unknown function (DUF3102)
VPLIRDALARGTEQYRRAGLLLREAKAKLKHGDWLPWLRENLDLTRRTASGYMRLQMGHPCPIWRRPGVNAVPAASGAHPCPIQCGARTSDSPST